MELEKLANLNTESYSAVAISTGWLSDADRCILDDMAKRSISNMVLVRDSGWFIKLYEELELNINPEYSAELRLIITKAHQDGFRLIEFDCDVSL